MGDGTGQPKYARMKYIFSRVHTRSASSVADRGGVKTKVVDLQNL